MPLSCGGLGQSQQLLIIIIIIFFFVFFFTINPKRADGKEDGSLPVASHPKRKGDNGKEEGRPLHDNNMPQRACLSPMEQSSQVPGSVYVRYSEGDYCISTVSGTSLTVFPSPSDLLIFSTPRYIALASKIFSIA
ncbi:hypothetical protein LY76DRAFT_600204 [Colletotrichum caudatum]|nr:hypothetical protein LY76DRAFT_600204 [Colletotrichum caudatum]